jgi:hypothetical protein
VGSRVALSQLAALRPALVLAFKGLGWKLEDLELALLLHHNAVEHDASGLVAASGHAQAIASRERPAGDIHHGDAAVSGASCSAGDAAGPQVESILPQLRALAAQSHDASWDGSIARDVSFVPALELVVRGRPALTVAFELCSGLVCLHGGSSSVRGLPFCTVRSGCFAGVQVGQCHVSLVFQSASRHTPLLQCGDMLVATGLCRPTVEVASIQGT